MCQQLPHGEIQSTLYILNVRCLVAFSISQTNDPEGAWKQEAKENVFLIES